jgi:hypothetical protein
LFQVFFCTVQIGKQTRADGCGALFEFVLMHQCPFHGFGQTRQIGRVGRPGGRKAEPGKKKTTY